MGKRDLYTILFVGILMMSMLFFSPVFVKSAATAPGDLTTTTTVPGGGGMTTTTTAAGGGGQTTTTVPGGGGGTVMGTVSYYIPYLHTHTNNVTYCYIANFSSNALTTSFTVNAAATKPVGNATTFGDTLGAGLSKMVTFSGTTISLGVETLDLASETGTGLTAYGGTLKFTTTVTGGASCKNVIISCFQGTTQPKRNVVGYLCGDDSTSGPGSSSILLGF
ncbi:MAG: hypothetical protein H7844_00560 [Nitrospirae bacterium YQR-1]